MPTEIQLEQLRQMPYMSRFNASQDRTMVLYKGDRPLQQAELVEAQMMHADGLAKLGDAFMSDGNLQSGMDFIKEGNTLTVKDGLVYVNGRVRNFKQQTVTLTGTGREIVGVKVVRYIITAEDDQTLLDQTIGVPSSFSEGADRLQETVVLTVDDTASAPIYIFEDGELFINTENPEMDKINKILAERTYDESGSYRVSGYDVYTEPHRDSPDTKVQLVVEGGKAYVLGYKVDKPTSTRIDLNKSKSTRTVNNEGFFYANATRKAKLGNSPVSRVTRVTGQVRVTKESVNRGVQSGGTDFLANTSVTKVERVWTEGSGAKEYVQGQDYQLVNGQSISWSVVGGSQPPAGSTYFVTYVYNKAMVENTDYKITVEGEGDNRTWWVDFNGLTGNKPIDDSLVNVDYDFYLARTDLVAIDMNGNIVIKEGQPEALRLVEAPNHLDPLTLRLGTITVLPDSDNTIAKPFSIDRLSMEDLQKLKYRVENLEYNDAINALDKPAMAGENPLHLRGVFSDGFISLDKYDTSHPDATVAFSFEDAEITLPYKEVNQKIPEILKGNSNAHVWGRLVTAPFTEEVGIRQPFATEAINVNPYNVFNRQGILNLNPSTDNWIEEDRITITKQETSTMTIKRWWAHKGESWVNDEKLKVSGIQLDEGQSWEGQSWRHDVNNGRTGTIMTSGGQETITNMIEFMRQREVEIHADNLQPNANNLELYFDGIRTPVVPSEGYRKGAETGTGMANADGTFKGKFTVPAGVRCGVREVTLKNADNMCATTYTAQGTKKTVQDIIIRTRVTINLYDPLAQSFQFDTNRVVSSIGIHMASKDANHNLIVQVRGISEGGQPNKTIYAEAILKPSDVKVSSDASAETKVKFDDPLMVEAGKEYCIVLITDSDKYTAWCATMGQPRIDKPTETVNTNPYLQGVLYSSSNASAWTVHQSTDMKFTIYTAKFNPEAVIEFDVMKDVKADSLILMSTYLTPQSTGCTWEMKLILDNEPLGVNIDDKPWRPIANYVDMDVNQLAREVKLKATFDANRYISPLLSLEDIMFVGFLTALEGSYVSRTIDLTDAPFNTIKIAYDAFTPATTTVTPRYSVDEGKTWKTFTTQPTITQQTQEFNRYEYSEKIQVGTATHKSFKIRLDLKSVNSYQRPRARRLTSLMKNE